MVNLRKSGTGKSGTGTIFPICSNARKVIMPENKSEIWCLVPDFPDALLRRGGHLKNRSALQAFALRAHAKQPPGTKTVTSDQWRVTSREHERRVPFPVLGPLAVPPTLPHFVYRHTDGGGGRNIFCWRRSRSGRDPSSGPRRLVRTPVAVHLLPWEKEKRVSCGGAARRAQNILFPLRGERVARATRFHQRARVG